MKRLVISTLSALALFSLAVPTLANELVRVSPISTSNIIEITPFNLVTGSYQGLFEEQGIPSSASFLSGIRTKKIKAEDLVRSAIAKGRLSEATLDDTSYLYQVQVFMERLDSD